MKGIQPSPFHLLAILDIGYSPHVVVMSQLAAKTEHDGSSGSGGGGRGGEVQHGVHGPAASPSLPHMGG
jgi:hypothetical protein